ncbi:MAG: zf-HC2 domain-containing protein [Gemmatimonadaceae bacterium]|nr:zf-HC2 domain-containing protein [Gemmatimonadaceae bacterium]
MTTLTCTAFADALPDLLDDGLDMPTRAAAEAHAATCAECGPLLAELRAIRDDAAVLVPLTPERDLWDGIAARIEAPVIPLGVTPVAAVAPMATRALRLSPRRLAAAAALLVAVSSSATWLVANRVERATITAAPTVAAGSLAQPIAFAAGEAAYDTEITALRSILAERRTQLDSTTIAALEKNLAVIDQAIAEAKAALAADPSSAFLTQMLDRSLDAKLTLLRDAALLPSRT